MQEHRNRSRAIDVDMWNAAYGGDVEAVKEHLKNGADPNHKAGITGHLPVLSVRSQKHVRIYTKKCTVSPFLLTTSPPPLSLFL